MSFLKIEDPEKRDQVFKEFLDSSKKRIQQNYLYDKIGEANLQLDLTKLYKPLIDSQAGIKENISKIHDQANNFTLTFSDAYPEIMGEHAYKELMPSYEKTRTFKLGKVATDYLRIKTYFGTPGLWELITNFNPDKNLYTVDDLKNYKNILIQTDAITTKNPYKPRSSRSGKYREIIALIWRVIKKNEKRESKGIGLQTIILPSDLNALIEILELRIAAWKAVNAGSRNKAVATCDELLRQGVINSAQYESILNNL
ncbi:uncharacterized protein LOC136078624 [Hydra vulgaris]|uniref:Uncharacterized protein LOC136078624 n=1 Tax=Hydra vulgaris TaxID=6087 RepID=A0ABM4BN17_HYDVU